MKMNDVVKPETFLQGTRGGGESGQDDMLGGLSWLAASPEDMLASLHGIGQLATNTGKPAVMDAIIQNAQEMNTKLAVVNKARAEAAKKDGVFALKLRTAIARTEAPGTNEARAVVQTMNEAAKQAAQAKKEEQEARVLLAQGDKRGAAAKAVAALTTAREAATKANRAEKTRLTRSLDKVAFTLDEQAKYVEGVVRAEVARSGETPRTMALNATAQNLRSQASALRKQSAVVATMPTVPENAPTPQRIADVANKFNIRTSRQATVNGVSRATISVLSDLAESTLAQARDYDGAVAYYGNDNVGRLMADIEFNSVKRAIGMLAGTLGSISYVETIPTFARAEAALQKGIVAAHEGYQQAVVPAYTGGRGTAILQAAVGKLSGLGALGGAWEDWCDAAVPAKTSAGTWYNGDIAKCKKGGIFAPWECAGRAERGVMTVGEAAACVFKDIPKVVGDIAKTTATASTVTQAITGNPTPPASTTPPAVVPSAIVARFGNREIRTVGANYGSSAAAQVAQQVFAPPPDSVLGGNTMTYVAVGAGVLAVGTAAYLFFIKPMRALAA